MLNVLEYSRDGAICMFYEFKLALEVEDNILSVWNIRDIGDLVNNNENVPEGFRKIVVSAGEKAEFVPVRPNEIISRLYTLLDNYKNI